MSQRQIVVASVRSITPAPAPQFDMRNKAGVVLLFPVTISVGMPVVLAIRAGGNGIS